MSHFQFAGFVVANLLLLCHGVDIWTRLDVLSKTTYNSINFELMKPVKLGNVASFTAGVFRAAHDSSVSAPLSTPLVPILNSSDAVYFYSLYENVNSPSTASQTLYALFSVSGVISYLAYSDKTFIYYGPWSNRNFVTNFVSRMRGNSTCGTTTSPLAIDQPPMPGFTGDCRIRSYVDEVGKITFTANNNHYDATTRPWWNPCKNKGGPTWIPISIFTNGVLGLTYCRPIYKSATSTAPADFLGLFPFDFLLNSLEADIAKYTSPNLVQYVFEISTNFLIATTVGEPLSKVVGSTIYPIPVYQAKNAWIRESYLFLNRSAIKVDGFYDYTGSDGAKYTMKTLTWTDPTTATASWRIVAVSPINEATMFDQTPRYDVVNAIGEELTEITRDAIYPASLLSFFQGEDVKMPLDTPLVNSTAPPMIGLTQQTLWGSANSFLNSLNVWIGYVDHSFIHYARTAPSSAVSRFFYRAAGAASGVPYKFYTVTSNGGVPGSANSIVSDNYDPTVQPWYTAVKGSTMVAATWSSFFASNEVPEKTPVIAFCVPLFTYGTGIQVLSAVAAVTRPLTRFTEVLTGYQSWTDVVYIMDQKFNLIGTSTNEPVWVNGNLKKASDSTNSYVSTSAAFLQSNSILYDGIFTIPMGSSTVTVVNKKWVDPSATLTWSVVSVTANEAPTSAPTPSPYVAAAVDDEVAVITRDASIAAAVFAAFIFIMGVVGMVAIFSPAMIGLKVPMSSESSANGVGMVAVK